MNRARKAGLCASLLSLSLCASAAVPRVQATDDAAQQLAAIEQRYEAQDQASYGAYRAAKTDDEKAAALAKRPGAEYIPEFLGVAEEGRGTETAAKAWMWVVKLGIEHDREAAVLGLDTLLGEHIGSDVLGDLPRELRYAVEPLGRTRVTDVLRRVSEGSPKGKVQAGALFGLGAVLMENDATDADLEEARAIFERLKKDFADVGNHGAQAAAFLFELDHLQVGMTAPDFEAVDQDGVAFKLSDYKGKVVLVDFWGFW